MPLEAAPPRERPWRLAIDTGGTFTDCVATTPDGVRRRLKVLSSSALRGRVMAVRDGGRSLEIDASWLAAVPESADVLLTGSTFRLLDGSQETPVRGLRGNALTLDDAIEATATADASFEIRSPEEAPVLAARLLTGTPQGCPLPPVELRLATTRGTNALLEGTGARTALFVTRGFADLLEIGNQARPDLFAVRVVKPPPLTRTVVEVAERRSADGTIVVPLTDEALEQLGRRADELLADGVESAAVCLMHADLAPEHEERIAELLTARGFAHVSVSSRLAARVGLVARAETTVVDATLSPVVGDYLRGVERALGDDSTFHVMTSAGGLVSASRYRAMDSLLSGPAGGVVGALAAGRRSGFPRVIGFDMGGTSTDVARSDGNLDYIFEHRVGTARLVAPALAIETVAAGGGSVCRAEHGRLLVGPESAGAHPGPACYGAGGPLTLTDVNLLLGRLDPERLAIPVDRDAARRALNGLVAELSRERGDEQGVNPEELLAGCLAIADERMADAVRRISVARGYDPADSILVAFGGAGGQHACSLAELLGISTVLVPEDAGLLSAVGLDAAVVERFAERQVLRPLSEVGDGLGRLLEELGEEARRAVADEAAGSIEVRRRLVHLRLAGQETSLEIEFAGDASASEAAVREAFGRAYGDLYGYPPAERPVEIESVRVVASQVPDILPPEVPGTSSTSSVSVTSDDSPEVPGTSRFASRFDRAALAVGVRFAGPALVFEAHAATVVLPGWSGVKDTAGALVLRRGEVSS